MAEIGIRTEEKKKGRTKTSVLPSSSVLGRLVADVTTPINDDFVYGKFAKNELVAVPQSRFLGKA